MSQKEFCLCETHVQSYHLLGVRWTLLTHLPLNKKTAIFADDIFKEIFGNEVFSLFIKISMKCVPTGPINNNPVLV